MSAPAPTTAPARRVPTVVRRLGWVSFFTDSSSEMIYPLLPALLRSLGAAPVWLGAMEGVAEAVSALVKYKMGPVTDRAPRKKPYIVAGYTLATFARPLLAFAAAGWHVVFLRAIDRTGKGVRGVPRDALLAESVDEKALATAFAFHRAMDNAGSVLGPILAFVLMRALELPGRVVILLAIVPGLASLATLIFGVHERAKEPPALEHEREPVPSAAAPGRLPRPVKVYLAVLALFTLGASADSFLLLRAVELGMDASLTPVLWLALSGAKALSNVPGGRLADRIGRRRTLAAGWLLYAVVYATLPLVRSPLAFGALVVVYGAYYGLTEGPERALLAELTPTEIRGRAFGVMHALTGVAVLPANLVFGALYAAHVALAFGVSAGCAALAAVLLFLTGRQRDAATPGAATAEL